jgi:hypothetical protein
MSTRPTDVVAQPPSPYVLPGRKRPASEVIVVAHPVGDGFARSSEVARALGDRFLAFAECQQQFLAELRQRLEQLDGAIAEDSRARLKGALLGALDVLQWCEAVQADLAGESGWAASGLEPVDVAALCRAIAAGPSPHVGEVRVAGQVSRPWWGDAARLALAVRAGLRLVSERIGGTGFREVEVADDGGGFRIRIAGYGEPGDGVDPASVEAFRQAAALLQARVTPDALGPGAAGLVLHVPARDV